MNRQLVWALAVALALQIIGATREMCPNDPNCVCGGTLAVELDCNIDGRTIRINLLPNTYISIKCENTTSLDYNKLPRCANRFNTFKSVSFKDCPLPPSSFKDVLSHLGVSKTMALIFQNAKNLSGYFDRKHFAGLNDLTKLLLSINGISRLPDNLFMDINNLTWLNIRSNTINLSEELFKPLEKLETLEISHNHMTNISSNLFSHLSYLRKLSLWQSNVTWFSKDLFNGVDVLEELDLSSNGLNELPSSIFKPLRKLKKLTLFSNKFWSLPHNLFKHNEELETVVILNNDAKLIELPRYLFGGLANLKQIYIQRSGIEKLPYDVFASSANITNISLAYNDIETLPEAIFNDQINLLELDLSHNKLNSLEPKLFSSLVRLESLILNHNKLYMISGSTFSSLLSLIYLDMEYNNLKVISSKLFSNNKQRMSISLAYNSLDFHEQVEQNGSLVTKRISPFVDTFNLRLLNLSHNKLDHNFADWWLNGHENLDITYNRIANFQVKDLQNTIFPKLPRKERHVWLCHNNVPNCIPNCPTYMFVYVVGNLLNIRIMDLNCVCPTLPHYYIPLGMGFAFLYVILVCVTICKWKEIKLYLKRKLKRIQEPENSEKYHGLLLSYDLNDETFIFEEILPAIRKYRHTVYKNKAFVPTYKQTFLKLFTKNSKSLRHPTTLTIFSPNYLMSNYSHIDIKKIGSEMSKAKNTVYIFADIGPENSVYAFLKDQRDKRNSVLWNDPGFWENFSAITDINEIGHLFELYDKAEKSPKICDDATYSDISCSRSEPDGVNRKIYIHASQFYSTV